MKYCTVNRSELICHSVSPRETRVNCKVLFSVTLQHGEPQLDTVKLVSNYSSFTLHDGFKCSEVRKEVVSYVMNWRKSAFYWNETEMFGDGKQQKQQKRRRWRRRYTQKTFRTLITHSCYSLLTSPGAPPRQRPSRRRRHGAMQQ